MLVIKSCKNVVNYGILNSAVNLSDHEALELSLNASIVPDRLMSAGNVVDNPVNLTGNSNSNLESTCRAARFDHCNNIGQYYEYTRLMLEPVSAELNSIYNCLDYGQHIDSLSSTKDINRLYYNVVNALLYAGYISVPQTKMNFYKV